MALKYHQPALSIEEQIDNLKQLGLIINGSKSIVGVENPKRVFHPYFLPKIV